MVESESTVDLVAVPVPVRIDSIGLLVEHEGWICRPVTKTDLREGQVIFVRQLYGQSVSLLRHPESADVVDVWLRCGRAAEQQALHQREAVAIASQRRFAEDVWWLREMTLIGQGLRALKPRRADAAEALDAGPRAPHYGMS